MAARWETYLQSSDGTGCTLDMFGSPPPEPTITTPKPITKHSDTHYTVKRSFVDTLLAHPSALTKLARLMPHDEGLKLYGIRRSSPLGQLGLQNGDLLRTINGLSIADMNAALEAFAQLRGASDLEVAITRRGQAMLLRLGIVER